MTALDGLKRLGSQVVSEEARRSPAEVIELCTFLVEGGILAGELGFATYQLPEERLSEVVDGLNRAVFEEALSQLRCIEDAAVGARKRWLAFVASLRQACSHGLKSLRQEWSMSRAESLLLQSSLRALLDKRWPEMQERIRKCTQSYVAGEVDVEEVCLQVATESRALRDTREIEEEFPASREYLKRVLGVSSIERDFPELESLATALALYAVLRRGPASVPVEEGATLFLVLAGRAAEGALATRLFVPYRRCVDSGEALPTDMEDGPFTRWLQNPESRLVLGAMVAPWGKLVKHSDEWTSHPQVGPPSRLCRGSIRRARGPA